MRLQYFNSIKVQLKLIVTVDTTIVMQFQFHKGTIKTELHNAVASGYALFQFHKGTIKTAVQERHNIHATSFQFHKGTIKTQSGTLNYSLIAQFQFHKGTIKTLLSVKSLPSFFYFNSIKVQLKLLPGCM